MCIRDSYGARGVQEQEFIVGLAKRNSSLSCDNQTPQVLRQLCFLKLLTWCVWMWLYSSLNVESCQVGVTNAGLHSLVSCYQLSSLSISYVNKVGPVLLTSARFLSCLSCDEMMEDNLLNSLKHNFLVFLILLYTISVLVILDKVSPISLSAKYHRDT